MSQKKYRIKKLKDAESSLYHNYIIRYNRARKALAKKGYEMVDDKLTKQEFIQTYIATKNTLEEMKQMGGKDYTRDVNRYIIERQKFEISASQAAEIKKHYREILELEGVAHKGRIPTAVQIRAGETPSFDILSAYYHNLRASGTSGKEASRMISQEIFGSD